MSPWKSTLENAKAQDAVKHYISRFFNFDFAPRAANSKFIFLCAGVHVGTLKKYPTKVKSTGFGKGQQLQLLPIWTAPVFTYASRHPWSPFHRSVTTTVGGRLTTRTKLEFGLTLSRQYFPPSTVAHTLPPFPSKSTNNYGNGLPFWCWHYLITSIFVALGVARTHPDNVP